VVSLIVFQVGKAFTGDVNVAGIIAALVLLGALLWQLFKPYKESAKLTQRV
jgi:ferrous iron transport protein B